MEYALFPIVLFGLSWIAVAFTTAAVYHAKGRSDWAGMAWGILFGWLALIYAVAMPTDYEALNERARGRDQEGMSVVLSVRDEARQRLSLLRATLL